MGGGKPTLLLLTKMRRGEAEGSPQEFSDIPVHNAEMAGAQGLISCVLFLSLVLVFLSSRSSVKSDNLNHPLKN